MIDLVHEVKNPEKEFSLATLATSVLGTWDMKDAMNWAGSMGALGEVLKDPLDRFYRFLKCIGMLLKLQVPGIDYNVKDVTSITSSKSSDSFFKVLKSLLTLPEPESDGQSQTKTLSREFWNAEVQDVIRTAGTHDDCASNAANYLAMLQSEMVETAEDGSLVRPVALSNGCCEALLPIVQELPKLKNGARKGHMLELSQALKQRAVQLGIGLLSFSNSSPNISSKDLAAVLETLRYFSSDTTCGEVHTKLLDWATKHNAAMANADFIALMDNYMEIASKQGYPEVIPLDAAEWKRVMAKMATPVEPLVREKLEAFLPPLVTRLFLQAASRKNSCFMMF